MIYEEKLDLILKALVEARKATGKQYHPRLYRDKDNKLDSLSFDQIQDILLQLEDDEKVIAIKSIPTEMKSLSEQTTSDFLDKKRDYFVIEILNSFDDWYSNFLIKERSKIENLSGINLKNITYILSLIEQELELSRSSKVVISYISSGDEISGYDTYDMDNVINTYTKCLGYLKSIDIIKDFKSEPYSPSSELTVNIPKFFEAIEKVRELNGKTVQKPAQNLPRKDFEEKITKTSDEPVYEITYTKQRQILMNNAQIGKPDFNSENDLVFSFLYEHPNESFTKEQIEKAVSVKLNKSLHKIVENLGFEGDTKEVFISVSKNAIQFRNPITKQDLEDMKKPTIKLIKGGGKLILPR